MFDSTEQARDAEVEFYLSADNDMLVQAWRWVTAPFDDRVDKADADAIPKSVLRADIESGLEKLSQNSPWRRTLGIMFEEIDWVPTCWKVRNEQYMAERMADEFKD